MSADERARLEAAGRRAWYGLGGWTAALGCGVIFLIGGVTAGSLVGVIVAPVLGPWPATVLLALGGACGVAYWVYTIWGIARAERASSRAIERDLEAGEVDEYEIASTRVIRVDQAEDEGVGFLFDVGEAQLFALVGQDLTDLESSGVFPSTRVVVVVAPSARRIIAIHARGERLAVAAVREPFDENESSIVEDGFGWLPRSASRDGSDGPPGPA